MIAVNSFPFTESSKTTAASVNDITPAKEDNLALAKHHISLLGEAEAKALLSDVFSSDIEVLIKGEKERAFSEGIKDAKEALAAEYKKQQATFVTEHDKKLKDIDSVFTKFSRQELRVELTNDDEVVSIVMKAIVQLLGAQLDDKKHVSQLVNKLATEHALSKQLVLTMHSSDIELIKTLSCAQQFTLNKDDELTVGDYRLELDNGVEEFSLRAGLEQVVDIFVNSLEQKNVG